MAKKSVSNDMMSMIKKGIALLASILTFIFFFLEMVAIRTKTTVLGKESISTEGVKFFDILFSEDYETIREELGLATTIMWIVFILTIAAIVLTVLAFIMKKGTMFSKLGAGLLVVAMLLLFVVNADVATLDLYIAKGDTNISNITTLYFVSLVISIVGLGSVATLKK